MFSNEPNITYICCCLWKPYTVRPFLFVVSQIWLTDPTYCICALLLSVLHCPLLDRLFHCTATSWLLHKVLIYAIIHCIDLTLTSNSWLFWLILFALTWNYQTANALIVPAKAVGITFERNIVCVLCDWVNIVCFSFVFTLAPVINITQAGRDAAENGRELRLELQSDSKVCLRVRHLYYTYVSGKTGRLFLCC